MGYNFQIFSNWMVSLNWSTLSQVIAAIATFWLAYTAWKGLQAWIHPINHKTKLNNVEELIEKISELHISMKAHSNFLKSIREIYLKAEDFTYYINEFNEIHKESVKNYIEKTSSPHSRIKVLLQKVELFGFNDFNDAQDAHNRLDELILATVQFYLSVSHPCTNEGAKLIRALLQKNLLFMEKDPQEILDESFQKLFTFTGNAQKELFGIKVPANTAQEN